MTGLITLREPIVVAPIPELDEDGHPLDWSHRQAAGLRFARWRADRGDFAGDRFGLRPEPLPPIVAEPTASERYDAAERRPASQGEKP